MPKGKREDLTGQRFNRLIVLELDENLTQAKGRGYWRCQCDCGNICSVKACYLKNGMQKSCGCYKSEIIQKQHQNVRHQNTYIEHENYYEGFDEKGRNFFIDKEDYAIISQYYWYITSRGYAEVHINHHTIKMHHLLLPL